MALPIIPVPLYPNVPALAGVPQLVRAALGVPPNPVPSLAAQSSQQQSALWTASQAKPTWGIYNADGTQQVLAPDNVYALDYASERKIPDYPIQNGSFASYNKVTMPFEASVRLTKGGTLPERQQFLSQIEAILGDLNLYTILTPERSYINCNLRRTELLRRSVEGAFFLEVDLFFRQILQVTAQYSISTPDTTNAQNPAAVPSTTLGVVQPSDAVPAAASSAAQTAITDAPN